MPSADIVAGLIADECDTLRDFLLGKNKAYGNSALDPVRIFSKAAPVEQILVRIDDKLSRLARGSAAGEDVEKDLLGYLVLLRVARRVAAVKEPPEAQPVKDVQAIRSGLEVLAALPVRHLQNRAFVEAPVESLKALLSLLPEAPEKAAVDAPG